MSLLLLAILLIIGGFLLGSIPFGLIIARLHGVDIRKVGSGNIGMTNVWRELGWKAGVTVLVLDAAKGWVAVAVAYHYFWQITRQIHMGTDSEAVYFMTPFSLLPMLAGLAAVLGHTFSPWLKFKGGKGVATGVGVALALYCWWIIIPLVVFLMALLVWRMVSLASILAALSLALISFHESYDYLVPIDYIWPFGLLVFLLVLWTHRENIKRILNGTERKVSFGRRRAA